MHYFVIFRKIWPYALIGIFLFPFIFTGCGKTDKEIIAEFKGGSISKTEYFDKYLSSTRYKPDEIPSRENLKEIVKKQAFEKLIATEAKHLGLDSDSIYDALVDKNMQKILYQNYVQINIVNKVITDSLVRKYYNEFSPQYKMSYIIRPVFETDTPQQIESQKDTIDYVYGLLKGGKDFADFAKKYSQDYTTSHKGGEIGFVIRESLGDEMLRTVMDTLSQFSYSEPIRGYEGFYILYKGEKRIVEPPQFSKAESVIRRGLRHNRQHIINDKIKAHFNAVKEKYNFHLNKSTLNHIITRAGGDTTSNNSQTLDFSNLTEDDLLLPLGSCAGDTFTVFSVLRERKRPPETTKQFRESVEQFSRRVVLAEHASRIGLDELPEVEQEIKKMQDSVLRSLFREEKINKVVRAKVDSVKDTVDIDPKEKALFLRRESLKLGQQVTEDVQDKLLEKYDFKLIESNVQPTLQEAGLRKLELNKEQSTES